MKFVLILILLPVRDAIRDTKIPYLRKYATLCLCVDKGDGSQRTGECDLEAAAMQHDPASHDPDAVEILDSARTWEDTSRPPEYEPNEPGTDSRERDGHVSEECDAESSVVIIRGQDAGVARRRVLYLPPSYGEQLDESSSQR